MKVFRNIIVALVLFTSCNNDDDVNNDATNETQCNYQGFSYLDNNNNDQTLIPESELNTQYFPNASNGPYGAPGIEIASYTGSTTLFFTTNVIALNDTGTGLITIDNGTEQTVTVTCQRAGTAVGDEVRLDVVYGSVEVEFCVIIDEVL
ncbi:hypothetical protein FHS04_002292 [Mesoflavibacter sabulilitoris]|uniref:Lipoprotein n=1 Tax=Mesoflavibacter zeaxanthinifaciens subsp. sabulilitoris TaxID=1520893 RepID=A0A2T1NFC0_9FLAO|nr:hypothetical protein [Mesoflavibacter zeaxanthinifaciens]MBB3124765.1 hypothetical protein [Mesoflavibacter zeaxanthinifaciens subsp. sabulilitoris]PSG91141.1 hypothetical protein C7H61_07775 [Mesoflavibacter zeaxanthinifaciens subsp. sabulilitoris]